jgi:hypothetical protein
MAKTVKRKSVKKPITKREVAKIAKASVKQIAEKKYMNTKTTFGDQDSHFVNPTRPVGNDYISCVGFSSTIGESDVGATVTYGGQAIHDLMCLRPFTDSQTDDTLKAFAPDGKFIQPVSCKTSWRLNRDFARIDPTRSGSPPDFPQSLAENCPIICRMIRCTANIPAGTATELDPDNDLFIDEYGRATGTAVDNFDERETLFYKVNKRRWTVLEDKKFKILSPVTLQYQQDFANTGTSNYTPIIACTNSNCEKYITTHHQLSKRKNGKVYYDKYDNETLNATAGHRREYVFYHFVYQGADAITGSGTSRAKGPLGINISCVNYTKFIDV